MTQRHGRPASRPLSDHATDRLGEHVESLVELEASDAEPHQFVGRRCGGAGAAGAPSAGTRQRSEFEQVDAIRDRHELTGSRREMPGHGRLEDRVGGDDAVGTSRGASYGPPERPVADALQPVRAGGGRAELLEPLRIQHQRHGSRCRTWRRAGWRRSRGRGRRRPRGPWSAPAGRRACHTTDTPSMRSSTVVPRRLASGNVT